jgi:hypothetical protein
MKATTTKAYARLLKTTRILMMMESMMRMMNVWIRLLMKRSMIPAAVLSSSAMQLMPADGEVL